MSDRVSTDRSAYETAVAALREAEARLALVAAVSEMIGSLDDPADLLYDVSRAVGEHLHVRRCFFTEIDLANDRGIVRRDYCRGVSSVAGVYKVSDYSEAALHELEAGRIVVNRDSKIDPRSAHEYEKTYEPNGERAYIAVPLLRDGRLVAELWISDDVPRDWSEQEVALLESVAERVWTAVEKLRVIAALRESEARERRLRAEADEASSAKDHFLALLSHELRTPMTTILGWASFLSSGLAEGEATRKGIRSIEQASRVQARLIDDLLDVTRIVTGKLSLERRVFDVTEAVRRAKDVIRSSADEKSITLAADLGSGPAFVDGDSTRIQQVVWNLLSNAVKFTPVGGTVTVVVRESGDEVEIRVRDNGVGIDPGFLPHVFDRFRQADDGPTRRFGGLGLGLSIVKHLTELHHGTVVAASEGEGRGAEFVVRLPRAEVASQAGRPHEAAPLATSVLHGARVLIVDDDPAAREVLGSILAGYGARIAQAASCEEALASIERARPDVLVSDIGMPGRDGYELIACVRESLSRHELPAVAVTAYADPRDRERALAAGYQEHLAKPVEPGTLAEALARVMRGALPV